MFLTIDKDSEVVKYECNPAASADEQHIVLHNNSFLLLAFLLYNSSSCSAASLLYSAVHTLNLVRLYYCKSQRSLVFKASLGFVIRQVLKALMDLLHNSCQVY